MKQDLIVILDLGATNNTEIARKIRSLGVYSEIHPHNLTLQALSTLPNVKGIIINGSIEKEYSNLEVAPSVYQLGVPLLSVAYNSKQAKVIDSWPHNPELLDNTLSAFIFSSCNAQKNWSPHNFLEDQIELIKQQVGNERVLLALSGGVDSSVVAALLIKAIGKQLTCVHVNHGFLRKGESDDVIRLFKEQLGANLIYVDASERFLSKLANVSDPEQKRAIIGAEFIDVFEEEARKLEGIRFLAQGTIYTDVVESGTMTASAIKAHHNVGALPDNLRFDLIEPLRMLFKDEVRACGSALNLPDEMVHRQTFPGPGLAVRCPGAITRERLEALRDSDAILREEFTNAGLDKHVFMFFTIIPDVRSTGIKNGKRSYDYPVVIRAVNSTDIITADIVPLDYSLLSKLTLRITTEIPCVNRVLYDLTPKPTATIEWE